MGAGSHELGEFVLTEGLDVGFGLLFEQQFFAHTASRVTGAALFAPQYGKINACLLHQLGHGTGDFFGAVIVARRTSHPKQHFHLAFFGHGGDIEAGGPIGALALGQAPRIAGAFNAVEDALDAAGDVALDHSQIAAHIDHQVDMVDQGRTFFDTGATSGAAPDFVFIIKALLEQGNRVKGTAAAGGGFRHFLTAVLHGDDIAPLHVGQLSDEELGGQIGASGMGRTNRLTAATAHTSIEVEALLPGQIVEGGDTQLRLIFFDFGIEIGNHGQRPFGTGTFEKGIERRVNQMAQAGIGDGRHKC